MTDKLIFGIVSCWCLCLVIFYIFFFMWREMDPNLKPQTLVESFDQANFNSIPEYM